MALLTNNDKEEEKKNNSERGREWEKKWQRRSKTKGRTDKYILKTSLLILVAEPRQIHE